jgi:hypothetical protein
VPVSFPSLADLSAGRIKKTGILIK